MVYLRVPTICAGLLMSKTIDIEKMIALAKETLPNSHSPYSKFPVACVIKTKSGKLFRGVNMENSAYPDGICAEGAALTAMVTAGEREVDEVLVLASKEFKCYPCGGCRQKLSEFSTAETKVFSSNEAEGLVDSKTMGELLPCSFSSDSMKEK